MTARLFLAAAFARRLGLISAALATAVVRRIVGIHLVGAIVGGRLVGAAARVGLVSVVVHASLVRVAVGIHLIGVMILIRFVRHAHLHMNTQSPSQ